MSFSELMGTAMRDADAYAEYQEFLCTKVQRHEPCGFEFPERELNHQLFDFQRAIVRWGLRAGRCAFFEDCGMGKTPQQLEWAHRVSERTGKPVIIFAPLAVAEQTEAEGRKFGIGVTLCESQADIKPGVNVTNYEKLHHFKSDPFGGIVLDESSILKSLDGSTRKALTEFSESIPYRLCCTATPAPNDYMELGMHSEFLGVMKHTEMLSMFFVHDGGDTSKWRLKKHAEDEFWKWVCSWAVAIRKPSDLGFDDSRFVLPPLHIHQLTVPNDLIEEGLLFPVEAKTLDERRGARRDSLTARVKACADVIAETKDRPWAVWCDLNVESQALSKAIPDSLEVTGSDPTEKKKTAAHNFVSGHSYKLVSKPSIFGWGMNWQHCDRVAFVGLSDSFEQFYQAVRRCWRFGQTRPVECYVITSEAEGAVVRNIERKQRQAEEMMEGMVRHMQTEMERQVKGTSREVATYERDVRRSEAYTAVLGDCVECTREILNDSVDYSIYSPPFASLYTYSNSERDMGNAKDYEEFGEHFGFLAAELYRVLKPGRVMSFHCMNLPTSKQHHGYIGIQDFRGDLIRVFQKQGFIFHSEVCIWKDPVTAMQRTKAIGLLYKQLRKDSTISRQGIPDYLVTMRKPGPNPEPVTKTHESFPVDRWQQYASPVWMDINQSDTLTREGARDDDDERHICPLQLQVIERGIELWTNPGDLVLSPFMGIGSEGHVALKMGRRYHGIELKRSYWEQACKNLAFAEKHANAQGALFPIPQEATA